MAETRREYQVSQRQTNENGGRDADSGGRREGGVGGRGAARKGKVDAGVGAWGWGGDASSVYEGAVGGASQTGSSDAAVSVSVHGGEKESAGQASGVDGDGCGCGARGVESGAGVADAGR